jgi:hypothetical protein
MEPLRGHRRVERRSLELHRAIAEKLRAHPELLEIAHDNLARWSTTATHWKPYLDKWRELLHLPLSELLELLVADNEQMTSLRQNTPFAGVLTEGERSALYDRFSAEHPISA